VDGLGTRHRAAVGITDVTDCVVVVVSEETHKISIANHGNIERDFNQSGEELRNPEVRQRVEKHIRRSLYNMLIGLEFTNARNREQNGVTVKFKWGFNLDAEDRERINKEREKKNSDRERFEKNYGRKVSMKEKAADLVMDGEETPDEDMDSATVELSPEICEETAGMPSATVAPAEPRKIAQDSDSEASDEA
jgi:hypothetical protein